MSKSQIVNRQEKANAGNVTQKIHPPLKQSTLGKSKLTNLKFEPLAWLNQTPISKLVL